MQEESKAAFTLCEKLVANPHLSDYFHHLSFSLSGSVEMADGAGHSVLSIVKGKFSIHPIDQNSIHVRFYDLVELHPYKNNEQIRILEQSTIKVTREEGLFALRGTWWQWRGHDESEWPCMLYWARYFFEVDPLEQLSATGRETRIIAAWWNLIRATTIARKILMEIHSQWPN
ncbi:hypothetical protein [Dictyobacter kobayashii]|uniref:hypothetical protein n=1 Tax=Dictyobacter kobayashii TaxID=2014872 RepID=UPI000F84CA9D|nr:hypothetical protein [Dictyobacter kobayashii]